MFSRLGPNSTLLKCATSLDGFLDHTEPEPLKLSSPEDFAVADRARAWADAIVVGAETVRRDNPRLLIKNPALVLQRQHSGRAPHPTRVTISSSGNLNRDACLFQTKAAPTLIFHPAENREAFLPWAQHAVGLDQLTPQTIASALRARGLSRILVEGGARLLRSFLEAEEFSEFHLSICPLLLGSQGSAQLFKGEPELSGYARRLKLLASQQLGESVLLQYSA